MTSRYSKTEIQNMALGHVGSAEFIATEGEDSREFKLVERYYKIAVETTLRTYPWEFARSVLPLELSDLCPTKEWNYFYHYPKEAVTVRRVIGDGEKYNVKIKIPWQRYLFNGYPLIGCNYDKPEGAEVTLYIEDESLFPHDFSLGVSFRLGYLIAPGLAKGSITRTKDNIKAQFEELMMAVRANSANEGLVDRYTEDNTSLADSRQGFGLIHGRRNYDNYQVF